MNVINCIIFVLAFLFVTYRIGIILSKLIKNEKKILNYLYGFLLLIGVNQIILTPCILLHTSFKTAYYLVIAINLLLVISSYFIKKPINNRLKKRCKLNKKDISTIVMCLLIFLQIILTTITYKSNADDSFYVSLSASSIDNESIYIEEPSMGYNSEESLLTITEQIPTYELQIAIWSKISGINPAIMCHSVLPMIIIFMTYLAFYKFAKVFLNEKYSKVFLIIMSIILLFTGFSTKFRTGCLLLKTWQGKAIFFNIGMTMVIASLIRIDKKIEKKDIIILGISNLFSIALTSTAIFLIPFLYLGFGILKLIKWKWKDILYLIISFIPMIIYILIYIILNQNVEEAFAVPKDEVSIIESLKLYKSNIYLIYYVIATIIIMFIGDKTAKRYFGYIQLINLLTIWNPFFSNFIARYFTSSAVFWRVLWILPIEFAIAYCIAKLIEKTKDKKIKTIVIVVSILILMIPGKFVYSFELTENLENMPQYIVNQTNYILENSNEQNEIVVLGLPDPEHNTNMRQISSKIKLIYSRQLYIDKIKNKQQIEERTNLEKLYFDNYIYTIEQFNELIRKYNIDWMIVSNLNTNLINYVEKSSLQKNCEIDGYTLYKSN